MNDGAKGTVELVSWSDMYCIETSTFLPLLGEIMVVTPQYISSPFLSVVPVLQSPKNIYTAPGPFSHPLGWGDTAWSFCLCRHIHSFQGPPERDVDAGCGWVASLQIKKEQGWGGISRQWRISGSEPRPSIGMLVSRKTRKYLGSHHSPSQRDEHLFWDSFSGGLCEDRGCFWDHPEMEHNVLYHLEKVPGIWDPLLPKGLGFSLFSSEKGKLVIPTWPQCFKKEENSFEGLRNDSWQVRSHHCGLGQCLGLRSHF